MPSLKRQTLSGIKWTFAGSIIQRIVSFATTVILARILSPADFGLFALAFVMIDAFSIFKSLGFDSALVRRKGDDIERACNTAFFLIPAMGIILFILLFILAPLGAQFLNNPEVTNVIRALGVVFVVSTFGKVPQTILYRDMKFKYKSAAEVSATIVYTSTAVILALNKLGVWSLVVAYILRTLTQVAIEWHFSGWRPKFEFDRAIAWDMFHFGKYVLAGGIIWFLHSNLDNIVIGKILGVAMLGYYAIAMNVSNFLTDYFLGKVGMIMYPAYSKIQEDAEDVRRVMLKTLKYVSILVFPFSLGLFAFAPDILRLVFGAKWLPATDILRILCFVGLFRCLGSTIWPAFLAKGRSKADFQISLVQVGLFFILMVPLSVRFGLIGAGAAVLLSSAAAFMVGLLRIKRIFALEPRSIWAAVRPALACSLLMIFVAAGVKQLVRRTSAGFDSFPTAAVLSMLTYFAAAYAMNKNILKDVRELLS